jgi:hypothetical protein
VGKVQLSFHHLLGLDLGEVNKVVGNSLKQNGMEDAA